MIREKSCGAVIFNQTEGKRLYLIEKMLKGHISLCKGHVEHDETEHQTALREIYEETGLNVCFIEGFRECIEYSPYPGCIKEVIFFLAKAKSVVVNAQPEEVSEIKWMTFLDAVEALTFQSDKDVLKKADCFLNSNTLN